MKNTEFADVVITGGGASGLAAAAELGMRAPGLRVVILEKNEEPGRKIRATGSGRCNITNRDAEGYCEIMEFFTRIGLVTRTFDNGLVYPYSESAADVADLLEARVRELGARILTHAAVTGISRTDGGEFVTEFGGRCIRSSYVIMACGGKAGPMFGTTGDGYGLARSLGHSIVTPVPVLTGIECREWEDGSVPAGITLAGTRTRGTVTLYRKRADGSEPAEVFKETGEIQFTRYGLSGICVFNMTRHMRYDRAAGESLGSFTVKANLFPDGDIRAFLEERRKNSFPEERAADVLRTVLKENIASYAIAAAGESLGKRDLADKFTEDLTDEEIGAISDSVHGLEFSPVRIRGWKEAQATSGGVSLDEIDPEICESRIAEGLFITGELADRDYMCGGFNLSNAWLTGMQAAREIASRWQDNVQIQNK